MNNDFVEKAVRLARITQAVDQPMPSDWERLEERLGRRLPHDFKDLVTRLGSGRFGEFTLLNPASSVKHSRFCREQVMELRGYVEDVAQQIGLVLYPEANGFFHVGIGTHRMDLLMKVHLGAQDEYTLSWLDEDRYLAHPVTTSVSQFLHDVYLGTYPESWTREIRELLWEPAAPFFRPFQPVGGE